MKPPLYLRNILRMLAVGIIYFVYISSWVPPSDWDGPASTPQVLVKSPEDGEEEGTTEDEGSEGNENEKERREEKSEEKRDLLYQAADRLKIKVGEWNHTEAWKAEKIEKRVKVLERRLSRLQENEHEHAEEKVESENEKDASRDKNLGADEESGKEAAAEEERKMIERFYTSTKEKTIAFVTAPDSPERYLLRALWLVRSLRLCGGSLAQAPFFLCLHTEPPKAFKDQFLRWNATISMVPLFKQNYKKCKPSQKLRFTRVKELYRYDYVVLLDDDTLVLQDPRGDILEDKDAELGEVLRSINSNSTTPANTTLTTTTTNTTTTPQAPVKRRRGSGAPLAWSLRGVEGVMNMDLMPLFDDFGLRRPKHYTETGKWAPYPYLNAGLLIFPAPVLKLLAPYWNEYTNKVVNIKGKYEQIRLGWFCEQVSLLLALNAAGQYLEDLYKKLEGEGESGEGERGKVGIPFGFVDDDRINFAWKRLVYVDSKSLPAMERLTNLSPVIIHYHKHMEPDGLLRVPPVRKGEVSRLVHNYNALVRKSIEEEPFNPIQSIEEEEDTEDTHEEYR